LVAENLEGRALNGRQAAEIIKEIVGIHVLLTCSLFVGDTQLAFTSALFLGDESHRFGAYFFPASQAYPQVASLGSKLLFTAEHH
jgi:hypothetical protein